MKRMNYLTLLFVTLAASLSCGRMEKQDPAPETGIMGELSIDINIEGGVETRAAYTEETSVEKRITGIQLLIFHDDGTLAYYKDLGTSTYVSEVALTGGDKKVWAVANAEDLSNVKTVDALTATSIELEASNDPESDFIMAGNSSVTVGSESSVTVVMSRFVSRIVLNRVTNSLPAAAGKLTVNHVSLSNVVGNQTLAEGSDSPGKWYNQMGRVTDSSSSSTIIDGSLNKATAPGLTFKSLEKEVGNGSSLAGVPYMFYTYPNDVERDATGWSATFTERKTRLVVAASFGGEKYYYPVTVGPLLRNNTYTVEMTITGPGSKDPDQPVQKGAFSVTVTPQPWQGDFIYIETI